MQNQILSQNSTAAKTTPIISLVIPVFNEIEVLPLLFERVRKVMHGLKLDYEMVMVDDGSKDFSADFLIRQAQQDACVRAVILSRNFGKEAALSAGLEQARVKSLLCLMQICKTPLN